MKQYSLPPSSGLKSALLRLKVGFGGYFLCGEYFKESFL